MKLALRLSVLLAVAAGSQAAVIFTLSPANINGNAGDTIGWGFTLENQTANYLLLTGSQYVTGIGVGTYTDYAGGYPDVIAPGQLLDLTPFSSVTSTGVGSYQITAAPGSLSFGQIRLIYDAYQGDPFVDDDAVQIEFSSQVSAAASVTVNADSIQGVPEPSMTAAPAILMLVVCGFFNQRRSARGTHRRRLCPREEHFVNYSISAPESGSSHPRLPRERIGKLRVRCRTAPDI